MGHATFAEMMDLEAHGPDTYVGIGPSYPWGGLYGGQIASQSLRAAGLTVDEGFRPHSLHGYFIRRGDAGEPIRFEVDRTRNGRSFATRRVVARQSQGAIFTLEASFHVVEDDVDVPVRRLDDDAGDPEVLPDDGWSHVFACPTIDGWDWENRPTGRSRAWFRMTQPVGDDPLLQACALTYVSDDLPTDAAIADHPDRFRLREEGDFERTFMSASLDHSIHFHRTSPAEEWQLHTLTGRGLVGARGLAIGDVFASDGTHVATVSQEILLRSVRQT